MKIIKFTIFGLFLLTGINLTAQVYVNNVNLKNSDKTNKTTKIAGIDFSKKNGYNNYFKEIQSGCDTIFSFATKPMPSGLTWDGQNLWYVNTAYIYKVNSSGIYIDSIVNPAPNTTFKGGDLCFDGTFLWYADEESAQLYKLNPTNGNVVQQFNLPSFGQSDPNGFGLAWDGINIWHSQYDPSRLYKLNPINGNIIDSLTTTAGIMGIDWINGNLYGISNQQIFKINPNTGAFQDSSSWCIPFPLGLTWDGSSLWNVSGQDTFFGIPTGGKQKIYKINSGFMGITVEKFLSSIDIYPNPASKELIIEILQNTKTSEMTCEILNTEGQIIRKYSIKNGTNKLDISELNNGFFIIKIKSVNGIMIKKMIKQ